MMVAYLRMSAVYVCNAGNQLGDEGDAAIGDGIKLCPQMTRVNLTGKLRGHERGV